MNNYFYLTPDGQQNGPVEGLKLKNYGVTPETLVWCDGMVNWTKAGDVSELAPLFVVAPPPSPVRPTPPPARPVHPKYTYGPAVTSDVCPSSNMVWAILATILCSPIFGIVAIVKASQVEKLWYSGDKQGAISAANSAKKWCWVAAIVGVVVAVIAGFVAYEEAQAAASFYDSYYYY